MTRRCVALALVVITGVGAWIRWRVTFESGLWGDEVQFLNIVALPSVRAMLAFLREQESHPPLFYLLMRIWRGVAGSGDRAMALLPLGFGLALPPAVYLAARAAFSARAALAAAAVAAISPTLVLRAGQIRPYSLLDLLYLASVMLLASQLFGSGRPQVWLGSALVSALMLWTHYFAAVILGAEAAAVGFALGQRSTTRRRALGWVLSQLMAGLLFLPWLPSFLEQMWRTGGHAAIRVPIGERILLAGSAFLTSNLSIPTAWYFPRGPLAIGVLVGGLFFFIVLAATAVQSRASRAASVLVAVPAGVFAVGLAASETTDLLVSHALSILAVGWCVLAGAGSQADGRRGDLALAGVLAIYGLVLAIRPEALSNGREMASALERLTGPGDLVLIAPDQASPAFLHYWRGPQEVRIFPDALPGRPIGYAHRNQRFADPSAFADAERAMTAARAARRPVWLVTYFPLRFPRMDLDPVGTNDQLYPHARTYELFRSAVRILGPASTLVAHCSGIGFEEIQALRFGPPLPATRLKAWGPLTPPMPAICDDTH